MSSPTSQVSARTSDEASIRNLLDELMEGWNRGDGSAFAAPFSEDADFVAFDGTYLRGRGEIELAHQRLFDLFLKGTRLVGKVRSVRFLAPEVALMHSVGGTVMAGAQDIDPERNSVETMVVLKRDGKWRIAAFQNTRAQFMGRPDEAVKLSDELRRLLEPRGAESSAAL